MWKVPANASSGRTDGSRSRGSRESTMFTLSCDPSAEPSRGMLTSTHLAETACSAPSASRKVTSPAGSTCRTSMPERSSAPAARAASARAPVTAPMPPTGTFQSPVPFPTTW